MLVAGVILILAIFTILGWRKGVIRIILSLASIVITIIAAVILAPICTSAIKNNTDIDEKMSESIYNVLLNNESVNKYFDSDYDIPIDIDVNQVEAFTDNIAEIAGQIGDRIHLPESLTNTIQTISGQEVMKAMELYSAQSAKEICLHIVALRMTEVVLTAIIYIVIMLIVFIALRIVIFATGLIKHLPVIKQADQLGGAVLGLVEGLVIVWIFFTIVTAISTTQAASNILAQIQENSFLQMIYNYNPVTKLLFNTMK